MLHKLFAIFIAYILDLIFGDPCYSWHPIRLIGGLIVFLEKIFYPFRPKRIAGAALALGVISISFFCVFFILKLSNKIHPFAGAALVVFFIYSAVSIKDLKNESIPVYEALDKNDIMLARKNLSLIVGRDTQNLDEKEITRAAVETIAESSVDGIISPLFFAFVGGAPLCIAYKAVNTLDSMLGHQNEKYKDFGWASAKIDELFNYIPARLSAVLFFMAGIFLRKNVLSIIKNVIFKKEFVFGHGSRIPEASMAELLGVRLGGVNYYQGAAISAPFMGANKNPLTAENIKTANRIMYLVSFIALITGVITVWLIR